LTLILDPAARFPPGLCAQPPATGIGYRRRASAIAARLLKIHEDFGSIE
jgi:hypothetical protein